MKSTEPEITRKPQELMNRRPDYALYRLYNPRKLKSFNDKLKELIGREDIFDLNSANVSEKWESCVHVPLFPENDYNPLPPPPTQADIAFHISSLRNGTAPGTDHSFTEFFRVSFSTALIYQFIRHAFLYNELTKKWTETVIVLLNKKNAPRVYDDFRRITLCSQIYKIYVKYLGSLLFA